MAGIDVPPIAVLDVPPVVEIDSPALPESAPKELCPPKTKEGEVASETLTPIEGNAIGIWHTTRVGKPVVRLNL